MPAWRSWTRQHSGGVWSCDAVRRSRAPLGARPVAVAADRLEARGAAQLLADVGDRRGRRPRRPRPSRAASPPTRAPPRRPPDPRAGVSSGARLAIAASYASTGRKPGRSTRLAVGQSGGRRRRCARARSSGTCSGAPRPARRACSPGRGRRARATRAARMSVAQRGLDLLLAGPVARARPGRARPRSRRGRSSRGRRARGRRSSGPAAAAAARRQWPGARRSAATTARQAWIDAACSGAGVHAIGIP